MGLSDEDTENMTPNYWTYVDDTTPAIDQVLNYRLKDGVGKLNYTERRYERGADTNARLIES